MQQRGDKMIAIDQKTDEMALVEKDRLTVLPPDMIETGQWYWVKDDETEWFGCVVDIGSNYARLKGPISRSRYYSTRIHFRGFEKFCRLEENPNAVIDGKVKYFESKMRAGMKEMKQITSTLNLTGRKTPDASADANSGELMVISGTKDIDIYRNDLEKARKRIPEIKKEIKEHAEKMTAWMKAKTFPLWSQMDDTKEVISKINNKIFSISLYAGIQEDIVQILEGEPATEDDKLHLMQRRLYMDEECLLDYDIGGMEYRDIREFDAWIARERNFKRILPFQKSMAAFRVRHFEKPRKSYSLYDALINIRLAEADKFTFFYIRNGDNLFRMNTEIEFDEMIFPDENMNLSEPMMIRIHWREAEGLISKREYDARKEIAEKKFEEEKRKHAEAERKAGKKLRKPAICHYDSILRDKCEPFDPSSIYYDDMIKKIGRQADYYNRIVLIIQGLFDRSNVLSPHRPVRTWEDESFRNSIKLVYDASNVLYRERYMPDFEAYRDKCNASMKTGSMSAGQREWWYKKSGDKKKGAFYTGWRTDNPGPDKVMRIDRYIRTGKAEFLWERTSDQGYYHFERKTIQCKITVPKKYLLNVDAYKPGDYKQFYRDPRTREHYLQWAPLLISAEEWQAHR